MRREDIGDLIVFLAVCDERSFTKAAARLGTTQSSVSHIMKRLEERLEVRLLTRTTRSVSPTEAGARLAERVRPALAGIEGELTALQEFRDTPSGTIRVTANRYACEDLLLPAAAKIMKEHPGINVEIDADGRFVDIAKEGFDAGVRLGEDIEKDMIAVRIGPDIRLMVFGSPEYFETRSIPENPDDLSEHDCINLRMPTLGGLYAWEFEKDGRSVNVRVSGRFTANEPGIIVEAALQGLGLACLPENLARDHINAGRLVPVLEDWCPPFPGPFLYFPSRRQASPAFRLFVDELRYRGSD